MSAVDCSKLSIVDGQMLCSHRRMHLPGGRTSERICSICVWRNADDDDPKVKDLVEPPPLSRAPCVHRGPDALRQEMCRLCGGNERLLDVFACSKFGECMEHVGGVKGTDGKKLPICISCRDYHAG